MTNPIENWRCAVCERVHEDRAAAQACCPPIRTWKCSKCDRWFDETPAWMGRDAQAEAAACCEEGDNNANT